MRIPSLATTLVSVLLPSVQTSRSGGSFQAIFASASEEGISRDSAKSPDPTGQSTTASDPKTDGGAGSQTEAQPAAQSGISTRAAVTVSPADLQKAPAKNLSRGQEVDQRQSEGAPGSSGTAKEKSAHSTSDEPSVRTASPATIASSMIVPAEQISRSYNIFQSMLATAPTVVTSENRRLSSDAKTQTVANTSSRIASISEMPGQIAASTDNISRVGISISDTTTRAAVGGVAGSPEQTASLLVPAEVSAHANVVASSTGQQGSSVNISGTQDSGHALSNSVSQSSGVAKAESLSTTLTTASTSTSTPTPIAISSALPSPPAGWSYSTFQMALVSASNQAVPASSAIDTGATTYVVANGTSKSPVMISSSDPSQPITAGQSHATAQTELVSAPEKVIVAGNSVLPSADTSASATAPSHIASLQEQRPSTFVANDAVNNIVAHAAVALPSAHRENSATVQATKTQGNWPSGSASESSTASRSTAKSESSDEANDVRILKVTQEMPQQRLDSLSISDISTPVAEQIKQTSPTVTSSDSVNQDQATSVISDGTPNIQSNIPAQPSGIALQVPVDSSIAAGVPKNGDSTQPAGKPVQKDASDGALKNSDPANSANTGTSKTTVSTNGSHDASWHDAQNSGQSSQDPQSHAAATAPKIPDTGASQQQVQAGVMHAVSHEIAAPHRVPDSSDNAARTTEERDVTASIHADGADTGTSGINTAKLLQTMSESEMRVGMHSAEFGNISIRTSISQQQMVAQISVDHSDLGQAISAHVSSAQTKLGDEHGIHALIEVNNPGPSSSGDSGHSSQREQRGFVSSARTENTIGAMEIDSGMNSGALMSAGNEQRLDIRA